MATLQEMQSTPMDTIPSPGLDAIMAVNGSPSGAADTAPVHAPSSAEHGPPSIDLRPGGIGVSEMVTPTLMPAETSLESRCASEAPSMRFACCIQISMGQVV